MAHYKYPEDQPFSVTFLNNSVRNSITKRAEFEKHLEEEREKLLAQYNSLKQNISINKHEPLTLIFQEAPTNDASIY